MSSEETPTPILDDPPELSLSPDDPKLITDRYVILDKLGEGGMGRVYRALDKTLDRKVAIKILVGEYFSNMHWTRFQREAKAASTLNHPSIVTTFDFGQTKDEKPYMVMDYVEGTPFNEIIAEHSPLDAAYAFDIAIQICQAMQHAHNHRIVHRDLKPSNIMVIEDGDSLKALVLDFGIAKIIDDAKKTTTLTQTGQLIGSPKCISPEQARGGSVDGRTDVYSLGCVLFEALTGTPPYKGQTSMETIGMHIFEKLPRLKDARQDLHFSDELETTVAKALAKSPDDRYQSMTEFANALQFCSTSTESNSETEKVTTASEEDGSKWLLAGLICLVLSILGGSIFCYSMISDRRPDSPAPETKKSTKSPVLQKPAQRAGPEQRVDPDDPIAVFAGKIGVEKASTILLVNGKEQLFTLDSKKAEKDVVKVIWLQKMPVSTGDIKKCCQYPNLRRINFTQCEIDPNALRSIAASSSIITLRFKQCSFQDVTYRWSILKSVRSLQFLDCVLTREDVLEISRLTNLRSLRIRNARIVSDKSLEQLTNLKNLKELDLSSNNLSDKSLIPLSKILSLERLIVEDNKRLSTEGFSVLRNNKRLSEIRIGGCPLANSRLISRKLGVSVTDKLSKGFTLLN